MSRFQIDDERVRELCLKGLSNRQIAERIGHGIKAVQDARRRIGRKSDPTACDAANTPSPKSTALTAGVTNCGE
jgi:transposase